MSAQEYPDNSGNSNSQQATLYIIKDETVQNPDGTYTRTVVKASRPPVSLYAHDNDIEGSNTVSTSITNIGAGQTELSSLSMEVDFTFKKSTKYVNVTRCDVDLVNADAWVTYKKGKITNSTGTDWASKMPYIKKSCTASGKNNAGQTVTLGTVWIQVYADGGYKTN